MYGSDGDVVFVKAGEVAGDEGLESEFFGADLAFGPDVVGEGDGAVDEGYGDVSHVVVVDVGERWMFVIFCVRVLCFDVMRCEWVSNGEEVVVGGRKVETVVCCKKAWYAFWRKEY